VVRINFACHRIQGLGKLARVSCWRELHAVVTAASTKVSKSTVPTVDDRDSGPQRFRISASGAGRLLCVVTLASSIRSNFAIVHSSSLIEEEAARIAFGAIIAGPVFDQEQVSARQRSI